MAAISYIFLSLALMLLIVFGERVATQSIPDFGAFPPIDVAESNSLKANAKAWLQNHPNGYVFRVSTTDGPGFVGKQVIKQDRSMTDKQMFIYSPDHQTYVNLGFKVDINNKMSAQELQDALNYIALDRLPVEDFEHPANWDVIPDTPVSSFSEGVTIEKFDGSQIKVVVKTKAYALYGVRNDINYGADRPQPEGTYFQVRQPFSMEVSLDVPIKL